MADVKKDSEASDAKEVKVSFAKSVPGGSELKAPGYIGYDFLDSVLAEVKSDKKNELARNAVASNDLLSVIQDRAVVQNVNHVYSNRVSKEGKSTSQKSSGRCWMFAMMNCCREAMMKAFDLPDDFELSQSYLFFFDKLEKANYFLENIIATRSVDVSERIVAHLLSDPISDGGQWDMLINLVEKYGLVPKSVYPDTTSCSASRRMNWLLKNKLRGYACTLREMDGADIDALRKAKEGMMAEYYRMLIIFFGEPPRTFEWSYYDKSKKHHSHAGLTPQTFYEKFVPVDISQRVSLINDPRNEYFKAYTVEYLGNIVGGRPVLYINLPIDELRKYATKTIDEHDSPVWFGCDVGKHFHRTLGVLDMDIFNYDLAFGTAPSMNKTQRLQYGESLMTHAMCLTAYDKSPEGAIRKWRVENSWGTKDGDSGYLSMADNWFSEYVYQIVVDKQILSSEISKVLSTKPSVLPAWDPMGSLARL
eukprot:g3846.t1